MAELEKVIKAWECCNPFNRRCFECPYEDDCLHDNIDRVAIADMVELLKEQQAEIELLKQEKADAVKRITEEIDLNPAYEPDCGYTSEIITFNYQLGYQEGLQKALNIINEP